MKDKEFLDKYEQVVRKNFYEGYDALIGELTTLEYQLKNGIENDFGLREKISDYIEAISVAGMRARIYEFNCLMTGIIKQLMHLNTKINRMNMKYENIEFLQLINMKVFILLNALVTFR